MIIYILRKPWETDNYGINDDTELKLIEDVAKLVNANYLNYYLIDENKATTEGCKKMLHNIKMDCYHLEEYSCGLL